MKKTLLATAVAGALGASVGVAQAATIYNQDGTQLDLYGNIQIAYSNINDAAGDSEDQLFDNGSTIGISGQHIINPGLTGYFKAEWEHDADEEKIAGGVNTGDQSYMGLKGNFGDARVGSWDPLIDDWIQDPVTNNELFDVSDSTTAAFGGNNPINNDREGDKIQYMSPSFAGLQFAVGSQFKGDAQDTFAGDDAGTEYSVDRDNSASFFGGLKYTVGAFSIAAAYDNLGTYDGSIESADGGSGQTAGDEFEAGDQYGVTAQYTMDSLRVAVKAEQYASDEDNADVNFYGVGARYGYGFGDLYGAYQYIDADADSTYATTYGGDSFNEAMLGLSYNISPAMYTYIEGIVRDREEDAADGVIVGAVYSF
ncbi:porin [Chromohalobacter japonicus]|uniref:Porin n=1 Tax=Chromohalobacter japonicus TaxID=223900 RepID=A0A1Q8TD43_9GAMM|nr:porin [Chromohalobacter japonicus]OLO11592.1 porin [Chromohalobacter japonicus]